MTEGLYISLFILGTAAGVSLLIAVILPLAQTLYNKARLTKKLRNQTIVAIYDAPLELSPAALGYLLDSNFNDKELYAMLLYLEQKGIIERKRLDGKTMLSVVADKTVPSASPTMLRAYQYASIQPSLDDQASFKHNRDLLESAAYEELIAKDIVRTKTSWSDRKYIFLIVLQSIITASILMYVGILTQPSYELLISTGVPTYILSIILGFPLLLALLFRSEKINLSIFGLVANAARNYFHIWPQVEGYKIYLEQVELERLKHESKDQARIDETLPYAIALNLRSGWQKWF